MSASMMKNRVQLIGHLGQNPEIKNFDNGNKMAKMSIATNETYKNNQGEYVQETQWHNIIAWGKVAEMAEKILKKGSEVIAEGKLIHRNYTDKDGAKKYITEVQLTNILLLDKKEVTSETKED
jgi:single-strand DNA-binding protein